MLSISAPSSQIRSVPGVIAQAAHSRFPISIAFCGKQTQQRVQSRGRHVSVSVVTDAAVPEGHKGLHETLYGEGDSHRSSDYSIREDQDDGITLVPVSEYIEERDGEKPLGVYALYNSAKKVQYIGYSRNMVLSIKAHLKRAGPESCVYVRSMVFANKAMATRQNLEREVENWLDECAALPPGNGPDRDLWEGTAVSSASSIDMSVMSDAERAAYEEKKFKMKKAMGEKLHDEVAAPEPTNDQRRENMMKALLNDDWSQVIDGQTKETLGQGAAGDGPDKQSGPIVSPFTQATVHREVGEVGPAIGEERPKMTVESVDKALEQVRPYLISDGGNVEVADVAAGVVFLRMEGACGTCSQSATTMKMGIERALKATFGDDLKEVVEVDKKVAQVATVTGINAHLDLLRGAIGGVGGKVEVVDVKQGVCVVKYKGPAAMGQGIAAAIKDTFARDIQEVIIVGF